MNIELLRVKAKAMHGARGIMKSHKATANWLLYKSLFGTGMTTALKGCRELGLEPDSNETRLIPMLNYIDKTTPT
jgi:hypothetical protein